MSVHTSYHILIPELNLAYWKWLKYSNHSLIATTINILQLCKKCSICEPAVFGLSSSFQVVEIAN